MKPEPSVPGISPSSVIALVGCQVGLHGCLNGARMAIPLQALQQGLGASILGLLMALFAVLPVFLALPAGRMADRLGYHRPVHLALALSLAGALVGALSGHILALCIAAMLVGAGSSLGMIALQRTAGRLASTPGERLRIFSWIALAPAIANFAGPMMAGVLIDHAGFRAAFAALALLPLLTLVFTRWVPRETIVAKPSSASAGAPGKAWDLLRLPDFRRLLFINWLIAATWDAHSFALPILGHERALSASSIGMVLAAYAVASAAVRLLIPMVAERLSPRLMMGVALSMTAAMFGVYPLLDTAWAMAGCAALLGIALGAVQPAVMSTLHQVTPPDRQGEAQGLRSTFVHFSTLVMPLTFGAIGAAVGVGPVFWLTAVVLSAGAWQAMRLPANR
ncbi:MAG: transporter [Polaromonas sp.]|jgi:MFS family permease|nr:transporter [Polaromonas sp.]